MRDSYGLSESSLRQLTVEWRQAQEAWRDVTADQFDRQFWEPLRDQTDVYLSALTDLLDVLQQARREIDSW